MTLEEIVAKFPPKEVVVAFDTYHGTKTPAKVSFQASVNEEGKAIYVVPGTVMFVNAPVDCEKGSV